MDCRMGLLTPAIFGNRPEFRPLDDSLNLDILHCLRMNSVWSCYIVDGEETEDEESNMCCSSY